MQLHPTKHTNNHREEGALTCSFLNPHSPSHLSLSKPPSVHNTTASHRDAGRRGQTLFALASTMGGGAAASASASGSFEQRTKRRPPAGPPPQQPQRKLLTLSVQADDDDVAAGVVPPVTVVLDGRCICHRVHLNRHTGYRSLASTLRRMFVDVDAASDDHQQQQHGGEDDGDLDLANAVPGHVVAYEDMEDDLLLAGDLKWNDFVRVAKRIRIIPAKKKTTSSRAKKSGGDVNSN